MVEFAAKSSPVVFVVLIWRQLDAALAFAHRLEHLLIARSCSIDRCLKTNAMELV